MRWFRGQWPKVKKMKFRKNYKNMGHAFRMRWSGQGCVYKLIIIRIVIYVLKQSRIVGGGHF